MQAFRASLSKVKSGSRKNFFRRQQHVYFMTMSFHFIVRKLVVRLVLFCSVIKRFIAILIGRFINTWRNAQADYNHRDGEHW